MADGASRWLLPSRCTGACRLPSVQAAADSCGKQRGRGCRRRWLRRKHWPLRVLQRGAGRRHGPRPHRPGVLGVVCEDERWDVNAQRVAADAPRPHRCGLVRLLVVVVKGHAGRNDPRGGCSKHSLWQHQQREESGATT
jgi:hypothetical protein